METGRDRPFAAEIVLPSGACSTYDNHYVHTPSAMRGHYADAESYGCLLTVGNIALYEPR